jgi:16S rRNA (uracil1498-N3)-methyltransferase
MSAQSIGGMPAPQGANLGAGRTVYLAAQTLAGQTQPQFALQMPEEQVAHLRAAGVVPGDRLNVVDAAQDYFTCEVVELGTRLIVRIAARDQDNDRSRVYLVQGLCEAEVMDTIVAQATEVGVAGFSFFTSTFSPHPPAARVQQAIEHWRSLSRYAGMQAGYPLVPQVGSVRDIPQTADMLGRFDAVVICWEGETQRTMADAARRLQDWGVAKNADVALVIGPRGGITTAEMAQLGGANERLLTVTLGPAILRVETAGVVAPALLINDLDGLA